VGSELWGGMRVVWAMMLGGGEREMGLLVA